MKNKSLLSILCLTLFLFSTVRSIQSLPLYGGEVTTVELDSATKTKIIEETAKLITDKYVFPDVAKEMANYIRGRLKENAYDHITSLHALTQELTKDLRSVNNDAHLGVIERRGALKKGVSP